ncbi:MAG: mercury methylation corrinoid protein HgcA [Candidatus Aminicenantes bacterium]|nr:mercury methylation corrinoid protein HgcA [Candidatus Aminicenantes bacterium]
MSLPKIPAAADLNNENCSCGEECCGGTAGGTSADRRGSFVKAAPYMTGRISTPAGEIPVVSSRLGFRDRWGTFRTRWGIGRSRYAIAPGLYALGAPDAWSPVFVTANYKMSFDRLRAASSGLNAWLMVLDTRGINVWCAAGKGSFGTNEVGCRVEATGLKKIVSHRTLILPQLGAPGVSAPEVAKRTGFRVLFGPIRAADLKAFLDAGMNATPQMRRVRFSFKDRITLVPIEISGIVRNKYFLAGFLLWLVATVLGAREIRLMGLALAGAIFTGSVLTPALLPWIPGRMFAAKGGILGFIWAAVICALRGFPPAGTAGYAAAAAYLLVLPPLSAFLAMNFTGSSTFTSLSGVVAEMKTSIPLMLLSSGFGLAAAVASFLLKG